MSHQTNTNQNQKRMRYAIYTRYSSDMQNEISLEAQEDRCRKDIAERGGAVVAVYSDGGRTAGAWTGMDSTNCALMRSEDGLMLFSSGSSTVWRVTTTTRS